MEELRRAPVVLAIALGAVLLAAGQAAAQMEFSEWLLGPFARKPARPAPHVGPPVAAVYEEEVGGDAPTMAVDPITIDPITGDLVDGKSDVVPAGFTAARGPACGGGEVGCGGGLECGGECGGYPCPPGSGAAYGPGYYGGYCGWLRELSLHAGIHGFKGPPDFGRNGNFGLHEGFNFGAPFGGPWGFGYQLGLNVVHSNFSGDQALFLRGAGRDQLFFTAGLFRRNPQGGWQWGAAFDLLHDSYYETANLSQVRSETSYVFGGGVREIGYFGMYGTGRDRIGRINNLQIEFEPTDLFAFFYRRHFSGGGSGRLWAGFTGGGDGLIGGDFHVPLGTGRWSLVNRFNYLAPRQGTGQGGLTEESWGVSIQLVFYPKQTARFAERSRFRPLFDVADNTLFMVDRGVQ